MTEAPRRILFHRPAEANGELSNFSPHPIALDGATWPTVEHYFQAQKFSDPSSRQRIAAAPTPHDAARMGRNLPGLREDWERVKEDVMYAALRAKFTQHRKLARRLLDTGEAVLVEHTAHDAYWGDGGDGSGQNRLGALLMRLRDELAAAAEPSSTTASGSGRRRSR